MHLLLAWTARVLCLLALMAAPAYAGEPVGAPGPPALPAPSSPASAAPFVPPPAAYQPPARRGQLRGRLRGKALGLFHRRASRRS